MDWCRGGEVHYKHLVQAERTNPAGMEKRWKRQVLDGTGSCSLHSTCRWLSCISRLSWSETTTAFSSTLGDQAALFRDSTACCTWNGPRKGGLNKAIFGLTEEYCIKTLCFNLYYRLDKSVRKSSSVENAHYQYCCAAGWQSYCMSALITWIL